MNTGTKTFGQLNDDMYDALHDFALARGTIHKRMQAVRVLVACYHMHDRFPRSSDRAVAIHRITVMPYITHGATLLFFAAAARNGEYISPELRNHIENMVRRADEARQMEVA